MPHPKGRLHPRFRDLAGIRFGAVVAQQFAGSINNKGRWVCICDCGKSFVTVTNNLVSGTTTSCGCRRAETLKKVGSARRLDLTNRKFGRLTAISFVRSGAYGHSYWQCQCDCGKVVEVPSSFLTNGNTRSCGCSRQKHGDGSYSRGIAPEYRAWLDMKQRCENPNCRGFKYYGARGIKIWPAWQQDYEQFLLDVGRRPSSEHSIDRIDNDGDYEPSNIRWATQQEQNNNMRRPKRGKRAERQSASSN